MTSFRSLRLVGSLTSVTLSCALSLVTAGCKNDAAKPDPGAPTTANAGSAAAPTQGAAAATGTTVAATSEVAVGKPPPDFNVKDHTGADLKLSALKGKPVVIYFYPKDETPGCTKEAQDFRDAWKDLEKNGAVVIGISTDKDESHKAFATHHKLPFHLVSDESGTIAKSFGVPNRAGFLGRQTFVVGADGNVKKIYRDVDVSKHASEVLSDVGS